jgi:hypothetical protein
MQESSRRLVLAVVVSAAVVLSAPYIGIVRGRIRAAFPEAFGGMVNGAVGVVLVGALVVGLRRIRERRAPRYAAVALAFLVGGAYAAATGSGDPNVRAVEHVHFIEFGLITWLFYRSWRARRDWSALVLPVLAAFIVGIAEEAFQWFVPARVGELRDVWLNLVAIGCGVAVAAGIEPPVPFSFAWRTGSGRAARRLSAVAVVVLAAFVHIVHLGQEIRDPDIGAFGSRYSAERLTAYAAERAAVWRSDPPLARPAPLSREDQYLTEGLQHVAARNAAWDRSDVSVAWRENLILETYFAPVLDTPSYVSATGHRWHPDHRADAEARAAQAGAGPFVSAAYPYPLFYWPPSALWAVALLAAGVLLRR